MMEIIRSADVNFNENRMISFAGLVARTDPWAGKDVGVRPSKERKPWTTEASSSLSSRGLLSSSSSSRSTIEKVSNQVNTNRRKRTLLPSDESSNTSSKCLRVSDHINGRSPCFDPSEYTSANADIWLPRRPFVNAWLVWSLINAKLEAMQIMHNVDFKFSGLKIHACSFVLLLFSNYALHNIDFKISSSSLLLFKNVLWVVCYVQYILRARQTACALGLCEA